MPEKQTNQERLKEITERIEAGIRDILESGDIQKYQEYLRTMSRFHRYSVNNQMLIHLQCPNATLVAGYSKWEKQFSRHVMQGEKGITIIAPTPYKKKIEQEKLDPDTKLPLLDENGDVILEEKEIRIPMFRPVKVFDYSQTDGKPLPEHVASPVAALTGDVENYEVFMEALRRSSPVPIRIKPLSSDLDGFFSPDTQSITLREGMSQVQTVCAAVHELAHARLHNYKKSEVLPDGVERGTAKSRNTEEVEAESISFMVCAYFGIETSGNSFGYVASWSKDATIPEFRASLDTIGKTANAIITDVETHFPVICKERGIELPHEKDTAQPEQEASTAAPQDQSAQPEVSRAVEETPPEAVPEIAAPPDPGMSIAAMNAFGYTDADMLPLSKERALELLERDIPVYMLMEDNAEAMAFEPEDIEMHTGMFGITRADWESVRDSVPAMDSAVIQERREQTFLNNPADSYAIFQLKSGEEQRLLRFENTDYRIMEEHPYDELDVQDGMEAAMLQNWRNVLAVYAVKVSTDVDTGMEVMTMDEEKLQLLREIFFDANKLDYELTTRTVNGERITTLHISAQIKDAMRMADEYGFTAQQREMLEELLKPDYDDIFLSLIGKYQPDGTPIGPIDISDIQGTLPDDLDPMREAVVLTAYQLLGKVTYFWGGKSLVLGWDSRWGTPTTVTAPGSGSTGKTLPFGLDCSGFVDWTFYNATGGSYLPGRGGGAASQHGYCINIAWTDALPGDLVFYADDSHVGIVCGYDSVGNLLVIHCSGGQNGVVVTGREGFAVAARPDLFTD